MKKVTNSWGLKGRFLGVARPLNLSIIATAPFGGQVLKTIKLMGKWSKKKGFGLVFAVIVALALLGFKAKPPAKGFTGTVAQVYDGDTVRLSSGEVVRYLGIDSPEEAHRGEPAEPFAREATEFNRRLVLDKTVRLSFDKEKSDRYQRLLAYVYLPDGTFVNGLLVREGLAWVYVRHPNLKRRSQLLKEQRRAMAGKKGVFGQPEPMPEPYYLTGRNSFVFHRPSCTLAKSAKGRRFKARYEALWQGYSPCRQCKP